MNIMGRHVFSLVMAGGLLAGCSSVTAWSKPGVSAKQGGADLQSCAEVSGILFDMKSHRGVPLAFSSEFSYEFWAGKPFEHCMSGKGYKKVN